MWVKDGWVCSPFSHFRGLKGFENLKYIKKVGESLALSPSISLGAALKTERQLLSVRFVHEEEAAKCSGACWGQHWGQRTRPLKTVGGGEEMSAGHVHC